MTIIIGLSSEMSELEKEFANYEDFKNKLDLKQCTHFREYSNVEMVIYNQRQAIYSCCYTKYKGKNYITNIYNRERKEIYSYKIKFDN